ncbi:MAG: ABC transporter permease [Candidatus Saccharibacteria bacterium]
MLARDIVRRSTRSLRSAKLRTLLTAFAISVGAFALTLTLGASNGAQSYVGKIINDNFDPTELIVTKDAAIFGSSNSTTPQEYNNSFGGTITDRGGSTQIQRLNDTDLATLRSVSGVQDVIATTSVSAQYVTRPGLRKYIATLAVPNPSQNLNLLAGSAATPIAANDIVLPEGFLKVLDFSSPQQAIGQKLTISVRREVTPAGLEALLGQGTNPLSSSNPVNDSKQVSYKIVAVAKKPSALVPTNELNIFASTSDVQTLTDFITAGTANYHKYITVNVKVRDGTNKLKLATVQKSIKQLGFGAQSVQDTQQFLNQIITVLRGIVTAFGIIALIASVFGVVNTMYISVLQRTREIGLMKALGMRKRDVNNLFRIEAALLGFLGGVIGCLAAVITGTLLNPWIGQRLGLGKDHLLIFQFNQIIILIAALMIVATLAGLLPARKAAKLDPIEALRTE